MHPESSAEFMKNHYNLPQSKMYFSGCFTKCNYISSTKQTGCFLFSSRGEESLRICGFINPQTTCWMFQSLSSGFYVWLEWSNANFKMLSLEAETELHLFRIPFLESSNLQDPRVLKQHLWHRELSAVFWYLNFGWIWVYGVFSQSWAFFCFPI